MANQIKVLSDSRFLDGWCKVRIDGLRCVAKVLMKRRSTHQRWPYLEALDQDDGDREVYNFDRGLDFCKIDSSVAAGIVRAIEVDLSSWRARSLQRVVLPPLLRLLSEIRYGQRNFHEKPAIHDRWFRSWFLDRARVYRSR